MDRARRPAQISGATTFDHPIAGRIPLDGEFLTGTAEPEQQLMVLTSAPGSPAAEALRFLGSWAQPPQPT
ncbi:MmyB family transcriptional regulator [Nonomuraea endophytica]|uniref:MmyB-like transcription regulator ligand binding domain-containing protein n=1 Tax=Nonomuraea endophytica TaxID=714136 RepID=A0A7W8AFC3_9ACTN|nr:hypothetical protein [Nonomuraea endophytica]MBB5085139.1 hypothetical protein [Nonomuraea endophytica]